MKRSQKAVVLKSGSVGRLNLPIRTLTGADTSRIVNIRKIKNFGDSQEFSLGFNTPTGEIIEPIIHNDYNAAESSAYFDRGVPVDFENTTDLNLIVDIPKALSSACRFYLVFIYA